MLALLSLSPLGFATLPETDTSTAALPDRMTYTGSGTPPGYTGIPGSCSCASGYAGTVTYSNGQPTGCRQIRCSASWTGYDLVCANGFMGSASWNANGDALSGCTGIPCTAPAFTGSPGQCQ